MQRRSWAKLQAGVQSLVLVGGLRRRNSLEHLEKWSERGSAIEDGGWSERRSSVQGRQPSSPELLALEAPPQPVLVVSDVQEREQLALWQQGNEAMYTQTNLDARCALRHDPIVSAQLRNWWKATQNLLTIRGKPIGASGGVVEEAEYAEIFRKVYKAMIEEYDEAEARRCVRDDWREDSGGQPHLSAEQFMDGVFELSDVWTESIKAAEYASFLRTLLGKITKVANGKRVFLLDDEIEAGAGIPEEMRKAKEKKKEAPPPPPPPPPKREKPPSKGGKQARGGASPGRGSPTSKSGKAPSSASHAAVSPSSPSSPSSSASPPQKPLGTSGMSSRLDVDASAPPSFSSLMLGRAAGAMGGASGASAWATTPAGSEAMAAARGPPPLTPEEERRQALEKLLRDAVHRMKTVATLRTRAAIELQRRFRGRKARRQLRADALYNSRRLAGLEGGSCCFTRAPMSSPGRGRQAMVQASQRRAAPVVYTYTLARAAASPPPTPRTAAAAAAATASCILVTAPRTRPQSHRQLVRPPASPLSRPATQGGGGQQKQPPSPHSPQPPHSHPQPPHSQPQPPHSPQLLQLPSSPSPSPSWPTETEVMAAWHPPTTRGGRGQQQRARAVGGGGGGGMRDQAMPPAVQMPTVRDGCASTSSAAHTRPAGAAAKWRAESPPARWCTDADQSWQVLPGSVLEDGEDGGAGDPLLGTFRGMGGDDEQRRSAHDAPLPLPPPTAPPRAAAPAARSRPATRQTARPPQRPASRVAPRAAQHRTATPAAPPPLHPATSPAVSAAPAAGRAEDGLLAPWPVHACARGAAPAASAAPTTADPASADPAFATDPADPTTAASRPGATAAKNRRHAAANAAASGYAPLGKAAPFMPMPTNWLALPPSSRPKMAIGPEAHRAASHAASCVSSPRSAPASPRHQSHGHGHGQASPRSGVASPRHRATPRLASSLNASPRLAAASASRPATNTAAFAAASRPAATAAASWGWAGSHAVPTVQMQPSEGRVKLAGGRPWSRGVPVDLYPTVAQPPTTAVKTISSVSELFG